jgi:hypothetical protein
MSYKNRRKERIQRLIDEAISRIETDLVALHELAPPAIKLTMADLAKANPDQISKIAQKSNINVVDKIQEAGEETPVEEPMPKGDQIADEEGKNDVKQTQQEIAVYNLQNWATQLQIQIGEGQEAPNGSIRFGYFSPESQQMINILVLSNGLIKMSGHIVQDFNDFKNITQFHKEG